MIRYPKVKKLHIFYFNLVYRSSNKCTRSFFLFLYRWVLDESEEVTPGVDKVGQVFFSYVGKNVVSS